MRKLVRVATVGACACYVGVSSAALAQDIPPTAKRHLAEYADCAKRHLEQAARKNPAATFERVEASLRPACGLQIELARDALLRDDFSRKEINAIIRSAYGSMKPEFRALFDDTASSERKGRQGNSGAGQPLIGAEAGSAPQDQMKAVERERTRFLNEASAAFDACLTAEIKSLVPASNEPAETLTKVIEIKCGELEKRLVALGVAFYGASRNDLQTIVTEPLEERKKRVVADIVTLRADLAKDAAKQSRAVPEANPGPKPASDH